MRGPNEFWLCYHQLLKAYEDEGQTPEARVANIIAQLDRMPAAVQQHIVDGLDEFLNVMSRLRIAVRSTARGDVTPIRRKWR